MDIEIQKQRETPLLSRKRVTAMVTFKGATPSRADLIKEIAKKTDADEKLTIIKHIYSRYGISKAKVIAHVYDDAKARDTVEDAYLLKKHAAAPKEKSAAPAADAAPAEKNEGVPTEEAKPEAQEEKKADVPAAPGEKKEDAPAEKADAPAEEKKEAVEEKKEDVAEDKKEEASE